MFIRGAEEDLIKDVANALDDKDWPVLRSPDMDGLPGLSLFAPRVLQGVSSMCGAP